MAASEHLLGRPTGSSTLGMVIASAGVAVMGSFNYGVAMGYSAPAQAGITRDLQLTLSEAMRVSALVCIVGWLVIFFAQNAASLDFGRFCNGCGIGVLSYVVPVFMAEIAPKALRGRLTTLSLIVCIGVSMTYIVGTIVSWRMLVIPGLVPCIILIVGLFFIPESPRWLAKVGRQKEFETALKLLRGKHADVSLEAEEIKELIESIGSLPKAGIQDLFCRSYIRPVIIGVGLMVFQQFIGIGGILFYASEIFVSAGFASGNLGTILMACTQVPITAVGALLVDRSGRKPLLLISTSGLLVGSLMSGIAFYLKIHGIFSEQAPIIALTGILVYVASFSLGMGSVPWVIMSEIFPINMKGTGGSFAALVNWFGSLAVSFAFNFLMSWSSSGTFFFFAFVCAVAIVFIVKIVPETKGKTLEEIQASINCST